MATAKQDTINQQVKELLAKKGNSRFLYSKDDFMLLSQYSGDSKTQEEVEDGWIWDFYTPDSIVKLAWKLAYKYGFEAKASSKILETSCGIGRFLRYAPNMCDVTAYEIDETSHLIASLLYPTFNIIKDSFESHFYYKSGLNYFSNKAIWDKYDLVIGNPPYLYPYSQNTTIYAKKELSQYPFVKSMEQLFIIRGVDCLNSNGLLIYVIPSSLIDNNNQFVEFKDKLFDKCNMIDSYRLPQGTFQDTDITTDLIVLQKKN